MAKTYTVDPGRKPSGNIILYWFATLYFRLIGWKVIGHLPPDRKMIVTAGPHTANLDGWLMVMTAWALRIQLKWMVKAELTRGPLGFLVRAAGGVGIDRKASYNTVDQVINAFNEADDLLLAVAPEGTRRKLDHWKTGFYWMADGADVPIFIARLDYGRKVVNLSHPPVHTTGDIDADMQIIFDAYSDVTAKHPEKVSEMRLRRSARRNNSSRTQDDVPAPAPTPPHVEAPDK
mgnify:CR=1 FL=1